MATVVKSQIDEIVSQYVPNPVQRAFHESKARIRGIWGGSGSGKSSAIAQEALIQALRYPNNEVIIARDVLADLKRTTKRTFLEGIMPPALFRLKETEWRESEQRLCFRHNGSAVQFIGLDKPGRVGSTDCGFWIIDEAHLLDNPYDWYRAFSRQARRHGTSRGGVFAGHPQGKTSWYYRKFFLEKEPDWEYFNCNPEDNRENLPPDFLVNLHRDLAEDKRYINRYVYGTWEDFEGQVFAEFDEREHYIEPFAIPKEWVRYRGMDYGLYAPTTCLWSAVDHNDCIYFYDEYGGRNLPIPNHVWAIEEKTGKDEITATMLDGRSAGLRQQTNSGLVTIRQQYIEAGLDVIPSATGKAADVEAGLMRMKSLFAAGKFKIFQPGWVGERAYGCPNLAREISSLVYKMTKEGQTPTDKFQGEDHYIDGARYIVGQHYAGATIADETFKPGSLAYLMMKEDQRMRNMMGPHEFYD